MGASRKPNTFDQTFREEDRKEQSLPKRGCVNAEGGGRCEGGVKQGEGRRIRLRGRSRSSKDKSCVAMLGDREADRSVAVHKEVVDKLRRVLRIVV